MDYDRRQGAHGHIVARHRILRRAAADSDWIGRDAEVRIAQAQDRNKHAMGRAAGAARTGHVPGAGEATMCRGQLPRTGRGGALDLDRCEAILRLPDLRRR